MTEAKKSIVQQLTGRLRVYPIAKSRQPAENFDIFRTIVLPYAVGAVLVICAAGGDMYRGIRAAFILRDAIQIDATIVDARLQRDTRLIYAYSPPGFTKPIAITTTDLTREAVLNALGKGKIVVHYSRRFPEMSVIDPLPIVRRASIVGTIAAALSAFVLAIAYLRFRHRKK